MFGVVRIKWVLVLLYLNELIVILVDGFVVLLCVWRGIGIFGNEIDLGMVGFIFFNLVIGGMRLC